MAMDERKLQEIRRRMDRDPKSVLDAARRGSAAESIVLGNSWPEISGHIQPSAALDVFLLHLSASRIPLGLEAAFAPSANLAFNALLGISKIGPFLDANDGLARKVVNSWAAIYKWCMYIFQTRIAGLEKTDARRLGTLDVLPACWYSISTHDAVRAAMLSSPETLNIATRLWLMEDETRVPDGPVVTNVPPGTAVLYSLLRNADFSLLEKIREAAGGKSESVAKFAISRVQTALKGPRLDATYLAVYMDLINALSRSAKHPFRNALLSANVIWHITLALVKVSRIIDTSHDPAFLNTMVSSFQYLHNCLESTDGFTWVLQAIDAGLLPAFCDCSPHFSKLDPEDLNMVLHVMKNILPRYLVYRSVIEGVDATMRKGYKESHGRKVRASVAKDAWHDFISLAEERKLVLFQGDVMKGQHLTCDNVKCQKVGTKDDVKRCGGCMTTFYCSAECQTTAWKEGDHRYTCKLKQQERLEGKFESISKKDDQFFHHLSIRDARKHLPHYRTVAKKDYPSLTQHDLVICINYNVVPTTYKLVPLDTYHTELTLGTANSEARNNALIEKVKTNRESFTLIESIVSSGRGSVCVLTLATGKFWVSDEHLGGFTEGEGSADEEEGELDAGWSGTNLDEVDLLRGRMMLDNLLRSMGEKPSFMN